MKIPVGTRSVLFGAHCFWIHPWFVAAAWWKLFGFPRDWRLWIAFFVHDLGYVGKPDMDGDEGERHVEWGANLMHRWFDKGVATKTVLTHGHWEKAVDSDGVMVHSRWSIPNTKGEYLFTNHYPGTGFGHAAVESMNREWNKIKKMPWELGPGHEIPTYIEETREVPDTTWRDFCLYHSRFYAKRDGVKPSMLCIADKLSIALEPWWLYLPRVIASGEIKEYMARAGGQGNSKYNGEPIVSKYLSMGIRTRTRRQWHSDMTEYLRKWVEAHKDGREDSWTPAPETMREVQNAIK